MTETPARDFLLPQLNAMLQQAARHGIARDVAVAVLIDLVTGPGFNETPLDPAEDTAPMRPAPDPLTLGEETMERLDELPPMAPIPDVGGGAGLRLDIKRGHVMGRPPR